jgi:hypothetical protein
MQLKTGSCLALRPHTALLVGTTIDSRETSLPPSTKQIKIEDPEKKAFRVLSCFLLWFLLLFCFVLFLWYRAHTASHSTSPFFVMGIFKIESHEIFAWAGFKLWTS